MRRLGLLSLGLILSCFLGQIAAAAVLPYAPETFHAAQDSDSRILVYVAASWCPTCSLQQSAIAETLDEPLEAGGGAQDLKVFVVDFDTQKDAVKMLGVRVQSTLILFRGKIEIARSIGETDPAAIKAFFLQTTGQDVKTSRRAAVFLSSAGYLLSLLAGILSNLSPCVLPLLPIVLASATAAHRFGVFALAGGVVVSYVAVGMSAATLGFGLGIGSGELRIGMAIVMMVFGLFLMSTVLQGRLAIAGSWLENAADHVIGRLPPSRLEGQFFIGILLGAVWTPCIGPTLAAAITLATERQALSQVAAMMLLFGLGATLPLMLIGSLSRPVLQHWERRLEHIGHLGEIALGALLVLLGSTILTGADRQVEALLLQFSPDWLNRIAIRF